MKGMPPMGKLIELCATLDQAKVLLQFSMAITEKLLRTTASLTAARGRGKSAAMGLAIGELGYLISINSIYIVLLHTIKPYGCFLGKLDNFNKETPLSIFNRKLFAIFVMYTISWIIPIFLHQLKPLLLATPTSLWRHPVRRTWKLSLSLWRKAWMPSDTRRPSTLWTVLPRRNWTTVWRELLWTENSDRSYRWDCLYWLTSFIPRPL